MNVSMKLTMDGLVRSLRGFAHDLADELERGYATELRRDETRQLSARSTRARDVKGLVDERRR